MTSRETGERPGNAGTNGSSVSSDLGQKRFGISVIVYAASQCIAVLRDMLYIPLIAGLLGQASYGIWSQTMITSMLLVPALRLRLEMACVRLLASEDRTTTANKYLSILAFIWLAILPLLAGLFFIPGLVSSALFGSAAYSDLARLLPFLLLSQVTLSFLLSYYRARSQIGRYAAIRSVSILVEFVVVVGCLMLINRSVSTALVSLTSANLVLSMAVGLDLLRDSDHVSLRFANLKPYLKFSLPLIPNAILLWVVNFGDRYVITHVMGLESVAVYSAAYRVSQLITFIVMPIGFVLYPVLSKLWDRGNDEQVSELHRRSQRYYLFLSVPLFVGLAKYGSEAIRHFGGSGFIVGRGLVMLLAGGIFFVGLYQLYVYIIHMSKRTVSLPFVFLAAAAGNIGLNLFAVPRWGLAGAAGATLAAYAGLHVAIWLISRGHLRVRFEWKSLGQASLASCGMVFILLPFPGGSLGALALAAVVGLVSYALLLFLICCGWNSDAWKRFTRSLRQGVRR